MSSFYDNDNAWSAAGRQPSWEQQPPPSRSGTASAASHQSDSNAFASQFEEIQRATDNLMKSGKWQVAPVAGSGAPGAPGRRESMPGAGRGLDYSSDPRMGGARPRHASVSEYEGGRPGSAGLQGYYQGQRFPGGRQSEAEQMLQAKRRMAAQRERELRNYHQEQQYNRTVSGATSDRSMSPATMNEEDRRELIARQHRALYGDNSSLYNADGSQRSSSQDVRVSSAGRGPSPLAYDPFGVQAQAGAEGAVQMPPRDRAESTASPVSNPSAQQAFGRLSEAQQSSRTSTSSPGASPPLTGGPKGSMSGVAPIGTRPAQAPGGAAIGSNKRSITPLAPSSLSFGFNASDRQVTNQAKDERSMSAISNPALGAEKGVAGLGNWGSNSGVWGSGKNTLVAQPSVWG
ncbi:transport Sec61 subunit beta [Lecanosticta acicola]|uniref:Transport Sec61 subunit beta n=1 Tax=Lecanosticta acicola TaxID=111012 RepID=A0AAI8Z1H7_9PEZI|nr:transport Sec61 subunit beta [Lecanosticta acicola]